MRITARIVNGTFHQWNCGTRFITSSAVRVGDAEMKRDGPRKWAARGLASVGEKGIGDVTTDIALASLYGLFAYAQLQAYWQHARLSSLLICVFEAVVLVLFLIRRKASQTSFTWRVWATAIAGTFGPFLLRPDEGSADVLIGTTLQVAGVVLQLAAVFSLGRSLGVLPALRRIKTGGLYRLVRHPLYLAYFVAQIGYLINNPTGWNVAVVALATACQVGRIINEENFLLADAEYAVYVDRVRWRALPGLW